MVVCVGAEVQGLLVIYGGRYSTQHVTVWQGVRLFEDSQRASFAM